MKKIILSATFAVMTVLGVHAGTWYYGTYGGKKDRIWFVENDGSTNWVFQTSTFGSDLSISGCVAGSGDLDLSTFTSDVGTGKKIVAITGRTFQTYKDQPITSIVAPDLLEIGDYAFNGNKNLPEVVSLPSVLKIGQYGFSGCSSVKEFRFASVTNLAFRALNSCSSVTNIVLSANLQETGSQIVQGCTMLENISPHYFPVLKKCGLLNENNSKLSNFVLYMDAPELTTLVAGFLNNGTTVGLFHAPKLKALSAKDFKSTKFLPGAGDLDFPELETLEGGAFEGSGLTSFRAPKLTVLNGSAFYNCSSLTNVVLSQDCKSFARSALSGCSNLISFEPLLPSDMIRIDANAFGGSDVNYGAGKNLPAGSIFTQPFIWDNAAITTVSNGLCCYFPLTNVTFLTQVDAIGASAFSKLAPRAEIHFYGSAPTLTTCSLYRESAEKNDERPVIHIHTASTLASWQQAAAPNAAKFETYRTKPDCPADAIGLVELPGKNGAKIYAYLVNDAPPTTTGYLTVEGVPVEHGAVDPEYGTRTEIPIGDSFTCTAPRVISEADVRAGLAGYAVSNVTATGEVTFRAEGTSDSYAYKQLEDSARLIWIWTNVQYRVTATADGHGSVSAAEQWIPYRGNVTLTATPEAGYVFRYWQGDAITDELRRSPTITFPVDGPESVTAVFTEPVTYGWTYDPEKKQISNVSSDGLETLWVFNVTGDKGKLTVGGRVSGYGELDFSTFDVPGQELVTLNSNAIHEYKGLKGTINFGTISKIAGTSCWCDGGLTNAILSCVTNLGESAFYGCGGLVSVVLSESIEEIGGGAFNKCRSLRSLTPSYLPALKRMGRLWGGGTDVPADLIFSLDVPALEVLDPNAFCDSGLTSFRAPKLTYVTNGVFKNCSMLTNAVFSQDLKWIYDSAFADNKGTASLLLEPFLPANMAFVAENAFGGGRNNKIWCSGRRFANSEFLWDNPDIREVPPPLLPNAELSHVVFKSDVTLVPTNAFQSLAARAVVEFHGPTVPELGELSFYYDGEPGDDRIRILVRNKDAVEGWRTKVAVNDALYRAEFRRKKPDWPGRRTLGILELSGTKLDDKTPVSVSYAWVVDAATMPPGLSVLVR